MGKAEFGTPKYVANQMKAKGLQRLRWYCQVCSKQCRDENGFKCHTQSESHVRNMVSISNGSNGNAGNKIQEYSNEFQNDFVRLLRSAHGEKVVNANRFYQEYISNKEHIHMNATRWATLTEFVKHLERSGICTVTSGDSPDGHNNGPSIAYIDNSPEAINRREYIKRKKDAELHEDEVSARLLSKQIQQAKTSSTPGDQNEEDTTKYELKRTGDANTMVKLSIQTAKPAISMSLSSAKKPNVFASKKSASLKSTTKSATKSRIEKSQPDTGRLKKPTSVLEKIMLQDQKRKGQSIR